MEGCSKHSLLHYDVSSPIVVRPRPHSREKIINYRPATQNHILCTRFSAETKEWIDRGTPDHENHVSIKGTFEPDGNQSLLCLSSVDSPILQIQKLVELHRRSVMKTLKREF
jgi:hypothetical protein